MGGEEVGWVAVDGERARLAQDAGVGAAAGDAEGREAALAGGFDVEAGVADDQGCDGGDVVELLQGCSEDVGRGF